MIGEYSQDGNKCTLDKASVIRTWGTTNGLGELINGPTNKTVLDPCGHVEFHEFTVVATLKADATKWNLK